MGIYIIENCTNIIIAYRRTYKFIYCTQFQGFRHFQLNISDLTSFYLLSSEISQIK